MAARQMEEIERKLATLKYPRAKSPRQSLLFAGMERYALLEWLFFRYKRHVVGGQPDKSLFSQQSSLQRDAMDYDEETARIQYWAEIAKFLGIMNTLDTEAISKSGQTYYAIEGTLDSILSKGRGSYEDRTEMLRLIVDLVKANIFADNQEWSIDEQVAKDIQLIGSIAEKQAQIFSEECKLFPADVQIQAIYPLPDVSELELAADHSYNPDEEYAEMESTLRLHLESFLKSTRSFNMIYTKEIRPWTHMMEVPQLYGFGPAANHLLEFLGNLRNLRDAHAALALGSSD